MRAFGVLLLTLAALVGVAAEVCTLTTTLPTTTPRTNRKGQAKLIYVIQNNRKRTIYDGAFEVSQEQGERVDAGAFGGLHGRSRPPGLPRLPLCELGGQRGCPGRGPLSQITPGTLPQKIWPQLILPVGTSLVASSISPRKPTPRGPIVTAGNNLTWTNIVFKPSGKR